MSILICIYTIHFDFLKVYTKFENTGSNRETYKQYVAVFFCYTIKLITIKLCTKFQNPTSSSCWEIFNIKKCPYVLYKSDRRTKWKKMKKEDKMRITILIFIYTIHFAN